MIGDIQVGFDLRHTRHYATAEQAVAQTKKALADLGEAGVVFNIVVVEQRKGGLGSDAEDRRHIPLLCCWRTDRNCRLPATQAAIIASQRRFQVFA